MIPVAIIAILYEEPDYAPIADAIRQTDVPTIWVDRQGVGSLAKAYNQGIDQALELNPDMLWCLSNVGFTPDLLPRLLRELGARPEMAALHPAYHSDHAACRPDGSGDIKEVPFIEFTCPLVRAEVLAEFPLDEDMPYWGHDLDWGYRVRQAGWTLGVDHGAPAIAHTYIRHVASPHPVTARRHQLRKSTDARTTQILRSRYGAEWKRRLGWV